MSQTVERAVAIIERISERPSTLGEVAGLLGVHKSTALRLLQTLEQSGFARREPGGRYTVGTRLIGIAFRALESLDVREVARPHLARLNQAHGHTVHLASLVDGEITYVDKYEGTAPIRMYSRIGKTAPLHASAVGKTILAHLAPDHLDAMIRRIDWTRYTRRTLTDEAALRASLAEIRAQGHALDQGEFEEIINCVAAPVRDPDGAVRSAVSISVPAMVMPLDGLRTLVPDLTATAASISRDLGWTPPA
ncbi:IclR family transcriptional regulator [Bailinhaonella thermotolerans]|uniref:IclR family transcriptional regulator n=1 Tax=Bailinhaonella thermotolerans TaxID=1070861 RepID=A0A3A4B6V0_9ACTN|nr:IclR family transcriptional regulator [Bailinhaonella thermotolerans]RJL34297.1 IclR family transcriptional regulator [Bailinhaonella thermotolerans]